MVAPKLYDSTIELAIRSVESLGLLVLRDIHRFSRYGEDFIFPNVVLAINTSGIAHVRYDHQEDIFHQNEVAVISPNHVIHVVETSEVYSMTLIVVANSLLEQFKMTAFRHDFQKYHSAPSCILSERQTQQLLDIAKVMETISDPELKMEFRKEAQCGLLHIFNELLTSFRTDYDASRQATRSTLVFNRFMDLLAANYAKEHEVQFYAKELCMTPKYFSKIITDVTGRGANSWINEYIINKAKNMLRTRPDLTLQKIGTLLGFPEQASFTRFFHKQAGVSPRAYRG